MGQEHLHNGCMKDKVLIAGAKLFGNILANCGYELRERELPKNVRSRKGKIVFGTLLGSNIKTPGCESIERWLKMVLFS